MKTEHKWLYLSCVLAVLAVAFGLRYWAVRHLPTDIDEYAYLKSSWYYADRIKKGDFQAIPRFRENFEHPPFAKIIYGFGVMAGRMVEPEAKYFHALSRVEQKRTFAEQLRARTVAAVFGSLSALLLALFNPVAGLFLAIHSFAVKYTSVVYLDAVPMFTSLVAALAYQRWRALQPRAEPGQPFRPVGPRDWWLVLTAAGIGLSAASKYVYGVVGLAIFAYHLWSAVRERRSPGRAVVELVVLGVLSGLFFLAGDPYLWPDPVNNLFASLGYHVEYADRRGGSYPFWQPLVWLSKPVTGHPPDKVPVWPGDILITWDLPIALLSILGLPRLFKREPVFGLWLIFGLGFLFLWNAKWPQYVLTILAPLSLSAGEGFSMLVIEPLANLLRRVFPRLASLDRLNPQR